MKKVILLILFIVLILTGCNKINNIYITFELNGGSGIQVSILDSGNVFTEPDVPSKEGHTFIGWFLEESFVNMYDFSNEVNDDLVLYAKWKTNKYILIMDDNDGNNIFTSEILFGEDLTNIEIPSKYGYIINKYLTNIPNFMPALDLTITLHYISEHNIIGIGLYKQTNFGSEILTHNGYIIIKSHIIDRFFDTRVSIYKEDDPTYHRNISSYFHYFPNEGQNMTFQDDYIFIEDRSYNSNQGAVEIFKFTDEEYYRIIEKSELFDNVVYDWNFDNYGDYLIMGVPNYGDNQGAIFIYKLSDPTYKRIIIGDEIKTNLLFGRDYSINGDYLVVYGSGTEGFESIAYIYKFSDSSYKREIQWNDDIIPTAASLINLKTKDDYIFINASAGSQQIAVYKFSDPTYESIIIGNSTLELFGYEFVIEGDYIAVKAYDYTNKIGYVYVYKISDFSYVNKYVISINSIGREFYIINDYLITTENTLSDDSEYIHIFNLTDSEYENVIEIDSVENSFKEDINISFIDDYIIINSNFNSKNTGTITIHKFSDPSYERIITKSDSLYFGYKFYYKDDYLIISGIDSDSLQGEFYVYKLGDLDYELRIQGSKLSSESGFGSYIHVDYDKIYVSAKYQDTGRGQVYVYELSELE